MDSPSSDEVLTYTITELSKHPLYQGGWLTHDKDRIWVVPEHALQWGFDNRHHAYAGANLVLPAEEQEWRDSAHYKAYVRPIKEEEE